MIRFVTGEGAGRFFKMAVGLLLLHLVLTLLTTIILLRGGLGQQREFGSDLLIFILAAVFYMAAGFCMRPMAHAGRNAAAAQSVSLAGVLLWLFCMIYVMTDAGHGFFMGSAFIWIFYMFFVNPAFFVLFEPLLEQIKLEEHETVLLLWSFVPSLWLWAGLQLRSSRKKRRGSPMKM